MKKKDHTVPIIVTVGLFLLTMILIVATTPEHFQKRSAFRTMHHRPASTAPALYGGRAHVEVIDQAVTGKVMILSTALKDNGYIVIHKEEKGKPGKIIGASDIFVPGLYSNLSIPLAENVAPGETLYAMLHGDNGDGVFNSKDDTFTTDNDGMVIMTKFMTFGLVM